MNIFKELILASKTLVRNFYKFFKANEPSVPKTASVSSQFHWEGEDVTITTRDLARKLNLQTGATYLCIF